MNKTKKLLSTIWNQPRYYEVNYQFDQRFVKNTWFKLMRKYSASAKSILDVGCDEGTILSELATPNQKATGVDISPLAIKMARKKYPHLNFKAADAENLPFDDQSFDFCYNVATLEHLTNPEKVIKEMIRVTDNSGFIAFWTVNFGSPFVKPRVASYSKSTKILVQITKSLLYLLGQPDGLNWRKNTPQINTPQNFYPDDDLVCEPYLQTLVRFLKKNNMLIIEQSSGWENLEKVSTQKRVRIICKIANRTNLSSIKPFCYWGNDLFLIAQKS